MIIMNKKELPKCSVEITLSLISNKVLTYNLREMEEDNLLVRKIYPEVPPKVEYFLTETGYSLKPILESMDKWGVNYREKTKYE